MMQFEQYKCYFGKIQYHRTDDLREGVLPDGSEVHLETLWVADHGRFEGDMIFQIAESGYWLPERDLKIEREISYEEYIYVKLNRKRMSNDFLKSYPLEFSQPDNIVTAIIEKVIKPAARDYVVKYTVEDDVIIGEKQYKKVTIVCGNTNFAKAYWYVGLLWQREIIPLI